MYFCPLMSDWSTHIYTSTDNLPVGLLNENFFHSSELFQLSRQTPRQRPYLVTVETSQGVVMAQMLALVRYRSSLFPPYFYMHCHVLGEGVYRQLDDSEELLEQMLQALEKRMGRQVLYIEFSHLSRKMMGYRAFRHQGFFPVKWMSIHNSLHSRVPEERITLELKSRIDHALEKGVTTKEVETDEEFQAFLQLLKHHNWFKPRRYMPADEFFKGLQTSEHSRLFITQHRHHVIGCSAVVYSQGQAYLWYSAFRRKSFALLHPDDVTVWHAIKDAYDRGYEHIFFLDVGLPFRKNVYRDFILQFGGKPVSTYRWFRCSIGWINRILAWCYNG